MITTIFFIVGGALLGLAAVYLIIGILTVIGEILNWILTDIVDLFS